ncbi:hypothetical protein GH741_19245 [Aquibacillus halophilus]|uniref:DUF3993 domain-containing protein n=1 Tax=Aquibacillus halophilus TaxID=930132 RepID=A0A6A8DLZ5_9BACI|nr:hypothetical protein [Aquibacillus halophilus]MRH44789.1 hypothetical protein [Aquibacillus halophilus]
MKNILKWITIIVLPLLVMTSQTTNVDVVSASKESITTHETATKGIEQKKTVEADQEVISNNKEDQGNVELTHEEIIELTDQFMRLLVQETDKNYKVKNYQTKDALIKDFESIVEKTVAVKYIDFYYQQKEDGLYILPTETPPWFQKKSEYEMMYLDENKMKIIQTNESDLYGKYTIELVLTFDERWRISNTVHS